MSGDVQIFHALKRKLITRHKIVLRPLYAQLLHLYCVKLDNVLKDQSIAQIVKKYHVHMMRVDIVEIMNMNHMCDYTD